MPEYIGHGIGGEGYGEIVRATVPGGVSYWRLDEERSWLEDPLQGGNSGLHHIFIDADPWAPGRTAYVENTGTGAQFPAEALSNPPNSGHIAQMEFPIYGIGNVYRARMNGAASDSVQGMILPGNIHVSYHLYFVWTESDAPPVYPTLRDALLGEGEARQLIQFNPDAALQRAIFQAGYVPNSPEFTLEQDGVSYVAQRAEHLQSGAVRIYYARLGQFDQVRFEER